MEKNNSDLTTLNDLIVKSAARFGGQAAAGMAFKNPFSYRELGQRIEAVAAFLAEWGVTKGERIAILAENSPQWGIAYFAIVRLGAIAVPILPDFPEADVHHILQDTEAKAIFLSQRQVEKIYEFEDRHLRGVFSLDDFPGDVDGWAVQPLAGLLAQGRRLLTAGPLAPVAVAGSDLAAIIYTSGTSGYSKGVMLSHANLLASLAAANGVITVQSGWTFLSLLPMSHAFEFTIGFLLPLANGARIVYSGKVPTPTVLAQLCREEKPQIICMVPMIFEKIYKKKVLPLMAGNPVGRQVGRIAFLRRFLARRMGQQLRSFFGGELVLAAIGGAPLNGEVENFLAEAGFPYLVGYGLTECAPLLSGGPFADPTLALGSAGKPVAGVELKIVDPDPQNGIGEIWARGPNVMPGYYQSPDLTAETIDGEGWLRTGDLGYFDDRHNLFIRGRSKNVIVFANGENIYPEAIEAKLNSDRYVQESLVTEQNGRLVARVYLDYDLVNQATAGHDQGRKQEFLQQLCGRIKEQVNGQLPAYAKLAAVGEQPEPFAKTATQKIKRYLYQPVVPSA